MLFLFEIRQLLQLKLKSFIEFYQQARNVIILILIMVEYILKRGIKLAKKFLWNIDLFASSQLLRHKNETNYSTLTGGCLSLIIIVIFATILIKDSISVLTKSQIIAQDSIYFVEDPTYTTFKLNSQSKFMIAVGITGLDLTSSQRYFDISLSTLVYQYGKQLNKIEHKLQPCKLQSWASINEIGASTYSHLGLQKFLCPTSDLTIQLQGKYTSQSFKLLELAVTKCQQSTDPTRPCVSDATVKSSQSYNLNYYFMNTYMNSGNVEPLGHYLQDRNYFGFTLDSTSVNNLYITENIMSTDNSLFPWEDIENKTIILVKQLAQVKNRVIIPDQYIGVYLRKSPYYIVSERSFKKIQDLLSAVGGLFGFALAFFFFMQFYTQASYEVSMGDKLFYYSSQSDLKSNGFNFFVFVAYLVYQFFRQVLCCQIPWQRMQKYYECREEIKQQLDVSLLLNKITFLQKCMNIVFEEHQFRAIYLQQKPNVKQAENLRKNHGLNKIIHKNSKKINNKIQQQIKLYKQKVVSKIKNTKKRQKYKKLTSIQKIIHKQSQKQEQGIQLSSNQKTQIQLKQIVANFILQDFLKPNYNVNQKSIKEVSQQQKQSQAKTQGEFHHQVQLQKLADGNHQSLEFINTALKDIKQIEQQSKQGNVFSQRIYNQLNNDITKQQLIVLKCLQTILENKQKDPKDKKGGEVEINRVNIFDNLIRLTSNNGLDAQQRQKQNGLQIVLQSNDRIVTEHSL